MDDREFHSLLDELGLSWSGYRKVRKSVIKRVRKLMQETQCPSVRQYLSVLRENHRARLACEQAMTVSISRFFRDRGLWQGLEQDILPCLIGEPVVKVWSAGCACGEEAYSFKILWERWRYRSRPMPPLEILATDMNPVYLAKAMAGVYGRSSLKEVPDDVRAAFFLPSESVAKFSVLPSLKEHILWKQENLLNATPKENFHLIFLRNNLLTYYTPESRDPAFARVMQSLLPSGYLVVGVHEKIPPVMHNLVPFIGKSYILQKIR